MLNSYRKKFLQIVFVIYIVFVFTWGLYAASEAGVKVSFGDWRTFLEDLGEKLPERVMVDLLSVEEVESGVNRIRTESGLEELTYSEVYCEATNDYFTDFGIDEVSLEEICPSCRAGGYVVFDERSSFDIDLWRQDQEIIKLLTEDFDHMCGIKIDDEILVALYKNPTPQAYIKKQQAAMVSVTPASITEQQLWDALVDYRHAHTKPDLLKSEQLCSYARERVEEHITLLTTKTASEYSSKEKYPLDNHAGFARDGESGYLFDKTGFNVVAENLAYWPNAESAHQVIEWGWDTSTEGHREAQLSTDYSHACLTGREGFFVTIFGRN